MTRSAGNVKHKTTQQLLAENEQLKRRLADMGKTTGAVHAAPARAVAKPQVAGRPRSALRDTDRHYRMLVEEMSEGALTLSEEGVLLYSNRRLAEMLGLALDQILGMPFLRFVPPHDRSRAEQLLNAGFNGPTTTTGELTLVTTKGHSLVAELSMRQIQIEGARCLNVVVMDITDHKRSEEQARTLAVQAQALVRVASRLSAHLNFEAVLEIVCEEIALALNVPTAIVMRYDESARALVLAAGVGLSSEMTRGVLRVPCDKLQADWTPRGSPIVLSDVHAVRDWLGLDEGDALGRGTVAMAPMWHKEKLFGVLLAIAPEPKREFTEAETELLRGVAAQAAQASANALLHAQVQRHADELEQRVTERMADWSAINRQLKNEIAERARTEAALRESELRFRRLAENAQDVIYRMAVAPSPRFEYVSPSVTLMTGYTPEEYYADADLGEKRVHPDDRQIIKAIARGETPPPGPLILRWIHKKGQVIWTEQRIVPLYDEAGTLIAIEGIARDITERKHAEQALSASDERFRLALAGSPITVFNQDCDLRYTWIYNPASGFKPEDFMGKTDAELWPAEQAALLETIKRPALASGTSQHGEVALPGDGQLRFFDLTVEPRYDAAGGIIGITCVSVDVTERKRSEQALEQANRDLTNWAGELEQRNREISQLNEMGDLLQSCLTSEEAYRVIVHSARKLFPHDSGALYVLNNSKNLAEAVATWGDAEGKLFEHVFAPDDCWGLRRGRIHVVKDTRTGLFCAHTNRDHSASNCLCIPMMAQGETLGVLSLISPPDPVAVSQSDSAGPTESKQRLAVSVAEHVALAFSSLRLRETLQRQAIRDPLTGLFNRRYMEESLERELRRASRKQSSVGIVMLDLDYFKHFNDAFGHELGDVILHEFGSFLQKHIRGGDIACRYGGEEFTLILPETVLREAIERAEQVRAELASLEIPYNGHSYGNLSVSLGIAMFPQHGDTVQAILRAADLALYRAKAEGRDRLVIAESPAG